MSCEIQLFNRSKKLANCYLICGIGGKMSVRKKLNCAMFALYLTCGAASAEDHYDPTKNVPDNLVDANRTGVIVFPRKFFTVVANKGAVIRGTLTGDWVAYKNNTISIECVKLNKICNESLVMQIGYNQIGAISQSEYEITKWDMNEILSEVTDSCVMVVMTIDINAQTVIYTYIPINQTTETCKLFLPTSPRTATIEDPPYYKK